AFFIDRMEVTVGQYNQFLEALKADPAAGGTKLLPITRRLGMFNKPPLPVTGVTFFAADAYARWSGKRLPTVLEWSHAAAGIKMPKTGYGATGTIAALVPAAAPGLDVSRYGAVAMAGNVREWTATWYAKDIYARAPADAPRGPEDGTLKIVKGGGWRTGPKIANINNYEKHKPAEAFDDIGFRCAVPFFRRPGDGMGRPPENKGLTGPDKEIVQ
ncbi:MAG: SUMF1/EgtB/PvdO family nonheme iron enzyme, partial [Planctomycetia bacterium]|nr:SUMF1/EgtB/PvdO family nonheme iron enzyme [Planctomycetia bacterium]